MSRIRDRIRGALVLAGCASVCLALAACGSSSSPNATNLLQQTFGGKHTVNSGNLNFTITVNPTGSSTLTSPLTLSFGGPFQSLGQGKLPASNFTVSFTAQGRTGSLGILSTGTAGFVTLQGTSYQLPTATFQRLESSFAQLATSAGAGGGSGALSKLGINPLHWLMNPSVIGNESVGGTSTTHIRAGIDVAALLADLNTFLQKASTLGVSGAGKISSSISAGTRQRIASEVKNPTFEVWTGTADKTIRRLALSLTIPVSGQFAALLGGLRSAAISVSMAYGDLNQRQTISAPTAVRPFSEFSTKLQGLVTAIRGAVGGAAGGSSSSGGSGTTTSPAIQSYTQCITQASGNVAKMQKCASLLSGSGG